MVDGALPAVGKLLREAHATVVYLAENPAGGTMVVKRLADEAASDPIGSRRFARERHFAQLLRHPSLPKLVASGDDWFATEYLDRSIITPGARQVVAASPAATKTLLRQLADALAYVHARGIIHRDIKPGHVMLRGEVPVLIDFGIAALRSDDALSPTEFAGSPAWMAPEQIFDNTAGTEADIWSFGLTALWLLTEQRPYSGSPDEVLASRRAGTLPTIDWQGAEKVGGRDLAATLGQCLAEPHLRPDAALLTRLLR